MPNSGTSFLLNEPAVTRRIRSHTIGTPTGRNTLIQGWTPPHSESSKYVSAFSEIRSSEEATRVPLKISSSITHRHMRSSTSVDNNLIDEVHHQYSTSFPKYNIIGDDLDNKLDETVTGVNQKIEKLDLLHTETRKMIDSLKNQLSVSETKLQNDVKRLEAWLAKERGVDDMKKRVAEEERKLKEYILRLAAVNQKMKCFESEMQTDQVYSRRTFIFILSILAVVIAYLWFYKINKITMLP